MGHSWDNSASSFRPAPRGVGPRSAPLGRSPFANAQPGERCQGSEVGSLRVAESWGGELLNQGAPILPDPRQSDAPFPHPSFCSLKKPEQPVRSKITCEEQSDVTRVPLKPPPW